MGAERVELNGGHAKLLWDSDGSKPPIKGMWRAQASAQATGQWPPRRRSRSRGPLPAKTCRSGRSRLPHGRLQDRATSSQARPGAPRSPVQGPGAANPLTSQKRNRRRAGRRRRRGRCTRPRSPLPATIAAEAERDADSRPGPQRRHQGRQRQDETERDGSRHESVVEPEPRQVQVEGPTGRHQAGAQPQQVADEEKKADARM